jgi:hypothetical protein
MCQSLAPVSHSHVALLIAHIRYVQVMMRVACRQMLALEARGHTQAMALLAHRFVQVVVPVVYR